MKIYTEEELRKHLYNHDERFFEELTPIELPTDEDIEEELLEHTKVSTIDPYKSFYFNAAMYGAKWMREQILNQNK